MPRPFIVHKPPFARDKDLLLRGGCSGRARGGLTHAARSAMTIRAAAAKPEPEAGTTVEVALVEAFEQPIGFVLRHRAIGHSLFDLGAHLFAVRGLDGGLHVGDVNARGGSQLFESLAALQGRGKLVGGHAQNLRGRLEFGLTEHVTVARAAASIGEAGRRSRIARVDDPRADRADDHQDGQKAANQ